MKKIIAAVLTALVSTASLMALDLSDLNFRVFGGAGVEMANAKGFKDTRLSDYVWYDSSEGSLLLPLEDVNGITFPITVSLGAKAEVLKHFDVSLEATVGFASHKTFAINADLGAKYYFVNPSSVPLHFGAGLKVGFFDYMKELGTAKVLAGTTPPVILPQGTIHTGDTISYDALGITVTPVIDFAYDITDKLSIGIDAGWQFSFAIKTGLTSGKTSVDPKTTDAYYVARTDKLEKLDLDPKVTLTGVKANLYVSYRLF